MPWYEVIMLYNKYAEYVDEENRQNEDANARYQEQYESEADKYSNMKMPEMPTNFDNISKGYSMPSVPSITMPSLPSI